MATKKVVVQVSKKKSTGSLSRISSGASVTSSKCARTMKTRSMTKAATSTAPGQVALLPSKLPTQQKVSSWMGEIQNVQLQSPTCEVEDYYSSNSSSPSPKRGRMSEIEVEFAKTVVMPAMMTGTTTLREEMVNMKVILEKLTRDNAEKEVRIKLQEEKIAKLTGKLEKWPAQSSRKDSESEDSEKMYIPLNITSPLDQ